MANPDYLSILKSGPEVWNAWREAHPDVLIPDLSEANLQSYALFGANLSRANLQDAYLSGIFLNGANLAGADLSGSKLAVANLSDANLTLANLTGAFLFGTDLTRANLTGAMMLTTHLSRADLTNAKLIETDLTDAHMRETKLTNARLEKCRVYGLSVWDVDLTGATQTNLIITPHGEPEITVDNLEVAQFIYMLLNHKKIRDVITTIGEKAILILGRFTPERKEILDAIAERLRELKYLPIIFDFEKIPGRDYTETIKVLAGLSKFVIADITQPKAIPQESQAIIPDFKIPFVRVIQKGEKAWSMSEDLALYDWVVKDVIAYPNKTELIKNLAAVIKLAERKYKQLLQKKAKNTLEILSIEELASNDND